MENKEQIITTKLTIDDIIAAANSAGISCENCYYRKNKGENTNVCLFGKNGFIAIHDPTEHLKPRFSNDHFCKEFKPKETE